jgi:hypothetical protein
MFYSSVEKAILKSEKSMLKFCLTIIIYPWEIGTENSWKQNDDWY